MASDFNKASADREQASKAAAAMSALVAKVEAELKKASAQAEKTRKELSDESDD